MAIDSANTLWFHHKIFWMSLVGKAALPLFCYSVAMTVRREAPVLPTRYVKRLFILAVLAQPFFWFAMGGGIMGNVVFTLALGAIFASFSESVQAWKMYVLYAIVLTAMLPAVPIQFGLAGVMLPSAILLALRGEVIVYPFLLALLFSLGTGNMWGFLLYNGADKDWGSFLMNGFAGAALAMALLGLLQFIRKRGRLLPEYALYVFYPAHMVALKLLIPYVFR